MDNYPIQFLRHALATVAYRGNKVLDGAPAEFATFRPFASCRSPVEILAHIGDLYDWALSLANGAETWRNSVPLEWDKEVARFHASLSALDRRLAVGTSVNAPAERLFQGPIADSLTHIGQIALLRRMSGSPIRGENYFVAKIAAGSVDSKAGEETRG